MKFTEEQYLKIVEAWEDGEDYVDSVVNVSELVSRFASNCNFSDAFALGNESSREWAHEKYVGKEKRYVWMLKTEHDIIISQSTDSGNFYLDPEPAEKTSFTEKEIENSPFKPEYFDKEEVE